MATVAILDRPGGLMKTSIQYLAIALAFGLVAGGCSSTPQLPPLSAPRHPDGSQMIMLVHIEAGSGGKQAEAEEFLISDLSGRLARYGWDAKIISDRETEEPHDYVAELNFEEFDPGNPDARKAGRIASRFGGALGGGGDEAVSAAAARLKVAYRAVDMDMRSFSSGRISKVSKRDWQQAVAWASADIAYYITKNLADTHGVRYRE
jgi:hypothetical protein